MAPVVCKGKKKKNNYSFQGRREGVGDKMSNYQKASESTAL